MPNERLRALYSAAADRDDRDPLASCRDAFHIPHREDGTPVTYLCGNSLGLIPRTTAGYVEEEILKWKESAVEGHFTGSHPWVSYHEYVRDETARLVGALPAEVVVMNSLTVNLHLMLVSFYVPAGDRRRIVIEGHAFPSDRYAVMSHVAHRGLDPDSDVVELWPREGEHTLRTDDIIAYIEEHASQVALVMLGGVNYYTGQRFNMEAITAAGHRAGAKVGFDLAHAAGNVLLELHDWGVDFGVWCSYKYLNAGPGGIAGCFVHEHHIRNPEIPRFAGWWGHRSSTRFTMPDVFVPGKSADAWQLSNPPILQLAALRASLEIFDSVGMASLTAKSAALTGFLLDALRLDEDDSFEVITPDDPRERGAQLSLLFNGHARSVFDHLHENGVICDYREPDVIRIAPVPLYNSFTDAAHFVHVLTSRA